MATGSMKLRAGPLKDQSIFVPVVIWDHPCDLKSQMKIECLRPLIVPSHLCPHLFEMRCVHRPLKKFFPDTSSSILGMDGNGNNVYLFSEDDVTEDLVFLSVRLRTDINQKSFRVKIVEVEEGGPIVRRFRKRLEFNLEDPIQIGEREGPNHCHFFIP